MVTARERKLIIWMIKRKLWRQETWMRLVWIRATYFEWLHRWLLKRQRVDDYHHAPACPANHYHNARLVFSRCTCGAEYYAKRGK